MKLIDSRGQEFGWTSEEEMDECKRQYNYAGRLINPNGSYLGFGMKASFVANTKISDMLL